MKKNLFAGLLLTGKVATLPLLISQARADVTPTYQDVIVTSANELRLIELPLNSGVRVQTISTDSNSGYGGASSYAAFVCNNLLPAGQSTTVNFVVAGVRQGETVLLVGASNKNDPGNLAADSRLTVGTRNLRIMGAVVAGAGLLGELAAPRMSVSFSVATTDIQSLASGGSAYVQAVTIPSGAGPISGWRMSELDEIRPGNCSTTSYGTTLY